MKLWLATILLIVLGLIVPVANGRTAGSSTGKRAGKQIVRLLRQVTLDQEETPGKITPGRQSLEATSTSGANFQGWLSRRVSPGMNFIPLLPAWLPSEAHEFRLVYFRGDRPVPQEKRDKSKPWPLLSPWFIADWQMGDGIVLVVGENSERSPFRLGPLAALVRKPGKHPLRAEKGWIRRIELKKGIPATFKFAQLPVAAYELRWGQSNIGQGRDSPWAAAPYVEVMVSLSEEPGRTGALRVFPEEKALKYLKRIALSMRPIDQRTGGQ